MVVVGNGVDVVVVWGVVVVGLGLVVVLEQRGSVVELVGIVLPPGMVLVGKPSDVDVAPKDEVVVVGQGPTPPPGRGQSKWIVVVVLPGWIVVVDDVPVQPYLWSSVVKNCRYGSRSGKPA